MRTRRMLSRADVIRRLPDLPRWLEARAYLALAGCELVTAAEKGSSLDAVIREPSGSVIVVGRPPPEAIARAVARALAGDLGAEVIAPIENAEHVRAALPDPSCWSANRAPLHVLGPKGLRAPPPSTLGTLEIVDLDAIRRADVDAELLDELVEASARTPVAAVVIDGTPVSFCYAGTKTETLWDVSIDTVATHRGRGHAARVVAYLAARMDNEEGRAPVWCALASNAASLKVAEKLGFVRVDELAIFALEGRAKKSAAAQIQPGGRRRPSSR